MSKIIIFSLTILVFIFSSANAKNYLPENELPSQTSTNDRFCTSYADCMHKIEGYAFTCNTKTNQCVCDMGYDEKMTYKFNRTTMSTDTSVSCETRTCQFNSTCTKTWGPHSYCFLDNDIKFNRCRCDVGSWFDAETGLCGSFLDINLGHINYLLVFGPPAAGIVFFIIFIVVVVAFLRRRNQRKAIASRIGNNQNPHQNPHQNLHQNLQPAFNPNPVLQHQNPPGFNPAYTGNPTTSVYPNIAPHKQ